MWAVESEPEKVVPEELCSVNADWDRWMPDPLEALHHTGPPWKRRIDLLSLLVGGIYGSKRSFLTEYRALLSQRLLKQLNFDTVAGKKHLELLKMRFGEVDMQECEVGHLFFFNIGTTVVDYKMREFESKVHRKHHVVFERLPCSYRKLEVTTSMLINPHLLIGMVNCTV